MKKIIVVLLFVINIFSFSQDRNKLYDKYLENIKSVERYYYTPHYPEIYELVVKDNLVFLNDVDIVNGKKIVLNSYPLEFDGKVFKNEDKKNEYKKVVFNDNEEDPDVYVYTKEYEKCGMSKGYIIKELTYDYVVQSTGDYYLDDFIIRITEEYLRAPKTREIPLLPYDFEVEKLKKELSRIKMRIELTPNAKYKPKFNSENIFKNAKVASMYPNEGYPSLPGVGSRNILFDGIYYSGGYAYDEYSGSAITILVAGSTGIGHEYIYKYYFGEEEGFIYLDATDEAWLSDSDGETYLSTLMYTARLKKITLTNGYVMGKIGKWTSLYLAQDLIIDTLSGSPRVNVRENPGTDAKVLFQLTNKTPVKTTAITREFETINRLTDFWVKIKTDDGREGWVFGAYTAAIHTDGPKYLL